MLFPILAEGKTRVAIDETVRNEAKKQRSPDIQNGVLLQNQCSNTNQDAEEPGCKTYRSAIARLPKILALHQRNMHTKRIIGMNTRKDIRRRVNTVQPLHHNQENVFIRKVGGTEIGSVRINLADYEARNHSHKEEETHFVKVLLIHQKKVGKTRKNIKKPEEVRHNKNSIKGDQIIEMRVHDVIPRAHRDSTLQRAKPKGIHYTKPEYVAIAVTVEETKKASKGGVTSGKVLYPTSPVSFYYSITK